MQVSGVYIDSIGVHLPEWVSAEKAVVDGIYDADIQAANGLTGTHIAGDVPAVEMAITAARNAVERSELELDEVESHIHSGVFFQGPEGSYPPGYILRELGVSGASSLDLRLGCNGLLGSLEVAVGQITGAAKAKNVLLTTAENWGTPLLNRWLGLGPAFILADGASSVLLSSEGGFAEVRAVKSGVLPELEQWHRGEDSLLPPQDLETNPYDLSNRATVFNEKTMSLTDVLEKLTVFNLNIVFGCLVDAGLNGSDLAKVIAINTDGRMIEQGLMAPLGLGMDRSTWDFGKSVGHMGGSDVIVSLNHLLESGELAPGDHVLLTSSGPGWTCTAAVITILAKPSWGG
ncbi:ketoacyl-ACP synthase III family protein [Kitasatospora azatica]|uniref:ketoacyl-ACP synthase III family protein n=1 Tax=Kitasatospora azatica TaxID=58347 RepID=UPI00055EDA99|nr:ketoacyl-ACP synthase III family protein [Kitasatospora azatica]